MSRGPYFDTRGALWRAHGRRGADRLHARHPARPLGEDAHGHHRRERGRALRHHAASSRTKLARAEPAARRRRHRGRPLQGADRSGRGQDAQGRRAVRHRRARARRHHAGVAGQDEAGLQEGRPGHRRQRLGHQRRRRRRGAGRGRARARRWASSRWRAWWATRTPASSRPTWASARCRPRARCWSAPA